MSCMTACLNACYIIYLYIINHAQVYEVSFWLMKYGRPSPKRLLLKSNWHHIKLMDLGKLPREERIRMTTVTTSRVLLSIQFLMHCKCVDLTCICIRSYRQALVWYKESEGNTVESSV